LGREARRCGWKLPLDGVAGGKNEVEHASPLSTLRVRNVCDPIAVAHVPHDRVLDRTGGVSIRGIAIVAILLNFGLVMLLFNPSAPGTAVLPNLRIASYLHEMPRPLWLECVSLVLVALVFLLPPFCFRFSLRWLDRWWLIGCALFFSGGLCNILERVFTGGVRDIYHVEGGLRYLCLLCGLRFRSYYGNPADLFQSVGLYSLLMILLVSRFWLIGRWFRSSAVFGSSASRADGDYA